jgi:hypothetical protein
MGDHDRRLLLGVVAFVAILALALTATTYLVILPDLRGHDEQIEQAIYAAHHAEYRICQRQMANRAALTLDRDHDEPRLPLLDCTPNLTGGAAVPMTAAQERALLALVRSGRAP